MTEVTTIAALATSPAPAGIAVIRVSGPESKTVLKALFNSKEDPSIHPRTLTFGHLLDFNSKEIIDHALAVFMPNPFSFTGEDVVEFQFHGSPFLVQKILRSLYAFGISPAEPGEFTKRAFLNGKMDLAQAEAVADIINATSEQALKVAGDWVIAGCCGLFCGVPGGTDCCTAGRRLLYGVITSSIQNIRINIHSNIAIAVLLSSINLP